MKNKIKKHLQPLCTVLFLLTTVMVLNGCKEKEQTATDESATAAADGINYSSGGFASIEINKPVDVCFDILSDVRLWPDINTGVTKKITILNGDTAIKKGTKFHELIASSIPQMEDWQNEWTVTEYAKGEKFQISGVDHFTTVLPVHVRITYEFKALEAGKTLYKRTIEADVDDNFLAKLPKPQQEAFFGFAGSQWIMARHLKDYVEQYPEKEKAKDQ